MSEKKKESLIVKFIKGIVEEVRIPKVVKRVELALAGAKNGLEDNIIKNDTLITNARKAFIEAAKNGEDLEKPLNALLKLKEEKGKLSRTLEALTEEMGELNSESDSEDEEKK